METLTGRTIDERYVVGESLGSGSFGRVYEATEIATGRRMAIKRMFSANTRAKDDEVLWLRLLRFPGVVAWVDDGIFDDRPYLVTEFVEGKPFPGCGRPCAWERVVVACRALLGVLASIHRAGKVHRDLKPENVLVRTCGDLTVLDMGLVREEGDQPSFVEGTYRYMAPEVHAGQPATHKSDIFAVGVMAYEALTGKLPFDEPQDAISRNAPRVDASVDVPLWMADFVASCLRRLPAERADAAQARQILLPAPPCLPPPVGPNHTETEFVKWFHGSHDVLEVPFRAARELYRRTAGIPDAVQAEVAAWVNGGIAEWHGQRLRAKLDMIERLEDEFLPESLAGHRLDDGFVAAEAGPFGVALLGGDMGRLVDEALTESERCLQRSDQDAAVAPLRAVVAAMGGDNGAGLLPVFRRWALLAVQANNDDMLVELETVCKLHRGVEGATILLTLLGHARDVRRGVSWSPHADETWKIGHPELAEIAYTIGFNATIGDDENAASAFLDRLQAASFKQARRARWHYQHQRYAESEREARAVWEDGGAPCAFRLMAAVTGAAALMEDGRFSEGQRLVEEAIVVAQRAGARRDLYELGIVRRSLDYRMRLPLVLDVHWPGAGAALDGGWVLGAAAIIEAAIAWRCGAMDQMRQLAQTARVGWGRIGDPRIICLSDALSFFAERGRAKTCLSDTDVSAWKKRLVDLPSSTMALQSARLAFHPGNLPDGLVDQLCDAPPTDTRREVFSEKECVHGNWIPFP